MNGKYERHGLSSEKLYGVHYNMLQRCNSKKTNSTKTMVLVELEFVMNGQMIY